MSRFVQLSRAAPVWGILLLAAGLWLSSAAIRQARWFDAARHMQAMPDGTVTSIPDGEAPRPHVFLDGDAFYWLHHAASLLDDSVLRVRHTHWDNIPAGRPVHWSSPLPWTMALLAKTVSAVTGRPATDGLALTAVWINPVLFTLLLVTVGFLLARRLNPWAAGLLLLALLCLPALRKDFLVTRIDHHGLVDLPALGMTLLLLMGGAGWTALHSSPGGLPVFRNARRWFIAAGIAGGCGLWFQASHQLILVAGSLASLLILVCFASRPSSFDSDPPAVRFDPRLWRIWALAGAGTSLAAWLLEYAPFHLGWRLEVNHPLYALAWWGSTETVLAIGRIRRDGHWNPARLAVIAAGLLPALAAFALMRLAPGHAFVLGSPLLQRIHAQIGEFTPMLALFQGADRLDLLYLFGFLPLLAIGAVTLAFSRRIPPSARALLWTALPALALAALLCLRHVRYAGLLSITLWNTAVALFLVLPAVPLRAIWHRLARGLLVAGCAIGLVGGIRAVLAPAPELNSAIIYRDVALELAEYPGFAGSRVLCGFSEAPSLHAFAGVRSTGGLYWENLAGLRAATIAFSESSDERILELLRDRGIGWIVLDGRPQSVASWTFNRLGAVPDAEVRHSFAFRLAARSRVPAWLELVPFANLPLASRASFLVYRMVSPDTADSTDTDSTSP